MIRAITDGALRSCVLLFCISHAVVAQSIQAPTIDPVAQTVDALSLDQTRDWLLRQGVLRRQQESVREENCEASATVFLRHFAGDCRYLIVTYGGLSYRAALFLGGHQDLLIYHAGHEAPPTDLGISDTLRPQASVQGIEFLSEATRRYDVLYVDMPLLGLNLAQAQESLRGVALTGHERFARFDRPGESALAWFLAPIRVMVDALYASYRKVDMVGFSGGGWSTTFYAALDQRIRTSISVAGSIPLSVRVPAERGDWEQSGPWVLRYVDYTTLYALAASPEQSRSHFTLFNEFDECCFNIGRGRRASEIFRSSYPDATNVHFLGIRGEARHTLPVGVVLGLLVGEEFGMNSPRVIRLVE
jgi:hypothetical protein